MLKKVEEKLKPVHLHDEADSEQNRGFGGKVIPIIGRRQTARREGRDPASKLQIFIILHHSVMHVQVVDIFAFLKQSANNGMLSLNANIII